MTDTTVASDNTFHFRKNLCEKISKLIMKTDDKIKMKNYNMILTENQQNYRHFHQAKVTDMNILQVRKYYLLIREERQNKQSLLILL